MFVPDSDAHKHTLEYDVSRTQKKSLFERQPPAIEPWYSL